MPRYHVKVRIYKWHETDEFIEGATAKEARALIQARLEDASLEFWGDEQVTQRTITVTKVGDDHDLT